VYVNTIKLPATSAGGNTFEGVMATISGFGKTGDGMQIFNSRPFSKYKREKMSADDSASRLLNHVQVSVISNAKCAQVYGATIVLASNICTKQSNKATCQVHNTHKIPSLRQKIPKKMKTIFFRRAIFFLHSSFLSQIPEKKPGTENRVPK
jgi:hypothetical protein